MAGDRVRQVLERFKAAGVTVDAVWIDWEGDPMPRISMYEQALHCPRCAEQLPSGVLTDWPTYQAFLLRTYADVIGAYLAGPARAVFPGVSVTNWALICSTSQRPGLQWNNEVYPPLTPPMITATNPVAYGNNQYLLAWWQARQDAVGEAATQPAAGEAVDVDAVYMHVLLRQVSVDAANRRAVAPHMQAVPWVARYCPDAKTSRLPTMSREAYREALRHLWMRDIAGMQVFNPRRRGRELVALQEVQDTAAVYDEMLGWCAWLGVAEPTAAEAMNLSVPEPANGVTVWSGLRTAERAVLRVVRFGEPAEVSVAVWPGQRVTLRALPRGSSYRVERDDGVHRVDGDE